ncbi:MAG: hypothetical protein HYX72_09895 [Acidobacteria bacterium]|nr:hypothetical protein [Acidobacteriota bacterium]
MSGIQWSAPSFFRWVRNRLGASVALLLLMALTALNATAAGGRSLFFPHLISGMGFETRIVLNNPSASPAQVVLTARNDDGGLLSGQGVQNPATVVVPARQQLSIDASDLFGLSLNSLALGWIQADSDNSQITGLLYISTNAQQDGVGVEAGDVLRTRVVGAIPTGLQTAVTLVNPNATVATVSMQLYDSGGQSRGQSTFTIPPRGHRSQFLNDGSGSSAAIDGGHFEIVSSVGLAGLEVMTGLSGYTLASLPTPTSGPFIFPRVVNGPEVFTTLLLANTSEAAVQVRWRAWDEQGKALQGSPVNLTIRAHGTFNGSISTIFRLPESTDFRGTVQADLIPVPGNSLEPALAAGLSLYTQGSAVTSLPALAPTSGIFMLNSNAGAPRTSYQLLNPGDSDARITLVYYDANGTPLRTVALTLRPHEPFVLDPNQPSSGVPAGASLVLMRATTAVVAYQLQSDSRGTWQLLGGRSVPAQVGGAVPLSAPLGGRVIAPDARASVDVPLGALTSDTPISIASLTQETAPKPPTGMAVLAAFQVSPLGLHFQLPVSMEFPVLASLPLPDQTVLQVFDPTTNTFQPTTTVVRSGIGGTTLLATVTDFPQGPAGTVFVVLVPIISGGGGIVSGGGGGTGGGSGGVVAGGGGVGGGQIVPAGGSGGVVTSSDGQAAVVIPPGALPTSSTVTVATVAPTALPNSQSVLMAMQVGPSGITFSSPVTLRFNVPVQLQGRLPRQLPLQVFNPLTNQYESTGFQAVLSADGTTLTASVTHFTIFVVLQPFTPFASPIVKAGTPVRPLGIASIRIPAAVIPVPSITSFTPTSGSPGTLVIIGGTGLNGATAVTFNGAAGDIILVSDSEVKAVVPSGATTGPIAVTTPGGTGNSSALSTPNFTITSSVSSFAPTIESFTPSSGPVGTTVTISGANFIGAAAVKFGSVPAAFIVDNTAQIRATVPSGAVTSRISVENPAGIATSTTDFTVTPATGLAPTITSFTPTSGTAGSTSVSITGTNFTGATGVTFNGTPAIFTVNSASSISATVPAAGTSGLIAVTGPGGTGASSTSFTVTGTVNGTAPFNLFANDTGILLPTASLVVLNGSALGTPNIGVLLPGATLTVNNSFTSGGTFSSGVLLPGASLTVNNSFSTGGALSSGVLLPGASLTVNNSFSTGGALSSGVLLPGATLTAANHGVDFTITKTHSGNFSQGQSGATYTIAVTNSGTVASSGTVTVTETLPAGLSLATGASPGITGTGWTCIPSTQITCSRTAGDALAAGASYEPITVTVDVSPSAPATVTNVATVSYSGSEYSTTNNSASDLTTITGVPDLTVSSTHTGSFTPLVGGTLTYNVVVTNIGRGATSGTVTLVDIYPPGGALTTISWEGFLCSGTPPSTLTCTRSDTLAPGASYPAMSLTVDIPSTVSTSVTNNVTVSGGGETNTGNNSATDVAP